MSRREQPRERSPEERARAAAERAARRRGETPPPAPSDFEPLPEPESGPASEPEPLPEPEFEPVRETVPPQVREPIEPRAARAPREEPAPPRPARRAPARPSGDTLRRARARAQSAGRRGAPARPVSRARPPRGTAHLRIFALLALFTIAFALWGINKTFQPFRGDGEGSVRVSIPSGVDAGQIGGILADAGVVDSGAFFNVNATLTLRRGKLRPGDYTLRRNMSNGAAIEALMQGPKAKIVRTISVTVPEGRSISETVPIVKEAGLKGSYPKAAKAGFARRRARQLGLPKGVRTTEGFLFPATYELTPDSTAKNLVTKQLGAFASAFGGVNLKQAKKKNLTRYDVLIIASMVEREAMLDKERPLIAAVIYNRLREGMPLGIDATIRYELGNWSQPLKVSELERDTPYNTRLNRGLPPTPIGNPGLASIKAAAAPAKVDFLYYVVKPGTCGEHAFSSSDAQFQEDVARYNAEREKAGGKSPTSC